MKRYVVYHVIKSPTFGPSDEPRFERAAFSDRFDSLDEAKKYAKKQNFQSFVFDSEQYRIVELI